MFKIIVAFFVAVLTLSSLWLIRDSKLVLPDMEGHIQSVSYNPLDKNKKIISDNEIIADLTLLSKIPVKNIRLYAANEAAAVLPILQDFNIKADLGIWLSANEEQNAKEIALAKILLKKYYSSISTIVVGNETLLRGDLTLEQLLPILKDFRDSTKKPVATAEPWHIWLKYPELAKNVDVAYVHILPYWEGIDKNNILEYTKERLAQVKVALPGKKIVIGEFGWPTQGYNNRSAYPSIENAADANRRFLDFANQESISYNLIEAFDSPFKGTDEGSVGAYWGLYNFDRHAKYSLSGEVNEDPLQQYTLFASIGVAWIIILLGLYKQRLNYKHAITFSIAASAMAFGIVSAARYPFINYMNIGTWVMWVSGCLLMLPLAAITLAKVNEIFRIVLGRETERLVPLDLTTERQPFVSIHVPAYKENPAVLLETIQSLEALCYDNYEVLIIINNTIDDAYKLPIMEACMLNSKFKYLDITCTGFKAGALNIALEEYTHPHAEIIAVIDADYTVSPRWLKDLVPLFDDSKVAIVQAPQDHRDGEASTLAKAMNAEYAGFFDIGMIQRNEDNAIVVHGTMVMVRRSAMIEVGGWGTDTICEDTELGLRLFEAGYSAYYTNRRYGKGLLPDTFNAFKVQRHRWAYGCIQIIKKHWKHMLPSSNTLSDAQKMHFVTGWFYWLSDSIGIVTATLNLLWVPVILFVGMTIPTLPLTMPILAAFVVTILHNLVLYRARVKTTLYRSLLSSIASMSLQTTMAKAVWDGIIKDNLPFKRTEKGGNTAKRTRFPIWTELAYLVLLVVSTVALCVTNVFEIREVYFYAATLAIQSIPFLSAVVMVLLDETAHRKGTQDPIQIKDPLLPLSGSQRTANG
jgi:cellulose synthase/poly-beta-1,6-N-acetylglucosamine synthase-like glycosyltransferase/exo-beta-1,3-glucanase (GH17 family)